MEDDYDLLIKIILIGDSGVGKTNLLSRFTEQEFRDDIKPTVGVEFSSRNLEIGEKVIRAQVWDTAGQEKFRAITHAYFRGAQGAIICFDITKESSFNNVEKWIEDLEEHADENVIKMLVGTKLDLESERIVRSEDGIQKAQQYNMAYIETSAKNATNVVKAFTQLLEKINSIMEKQQKEYIKRVSVIHIPATIQIEQIKGSQDEKKKKSCC